LPAKRLALCVGLPLAGLAASVGSTLLFGLPPVAAMAGLLLAVAPALFGDR
jgi:chromate transport protein ChrA